jgi:hypothetical protein
VSYADAFHIRLRQRLVGEAIEAGVPQPIAYARANKVVAILNQVPEAETVSDVQGLADILEAATPEQRREFCRVYAKTRTPPSDETWALVVREVRRRWPTNYPRGPVSNLFPGGAMTPANSNSRNDPADHITRG